MNIVRNNLKKHGVKFLKKDKKLETLTIKTEIGTKKKFLEYVDLYSRAPCLLICVLPAFYCACNATIWT